MSRAPEVLPVRQSSVSSSFPGRLAVWAAASLAVAASAGCMSVSDDEGGKPAPHSSTGRRGTVSEPDGGHGVSGGGRQARGGRGGSDAKAGAGAKASASPNASAPPKAQPPRSGQRPQPPRDPGPTGGGPVPSEQPPPQPTPSELPPESPTPQPSEPTDAPSASSAPEVHAEAMRMADGQGSMADGQCMEPTASPQVGPV
ncbi:hypothetical protein OG735_20275 [Streptomyces sp. NBC_01210]|uniref:hypothetical protein n=1 Tax=Streptomyces sp. NBC_01210 TaxID=2903774 RepID=UPI002E0F8302|nr:hypothetical protein OG735_20275 [Streptomyces sp. NBC_01210]